LLLFFQDIPSSRIPGNHRASEDLSGSGQQVPTSMQALRMGSSEEAALLGWGSFIQLAA